MFVPHFTNQHEVFAQSLERPLSTIIDLQNGGAFYCSNISSKYEHPDMSAVLSSDFFSQFGVPSNVTEVRFSNAVLGSITDSPSVLRVDVTNFERPFFFEDLKRANFGKVLFGKVMFRMVREEMVFDLYEDVEITKD